VTPSPPYTVYLGWDAAQMRAWCVASFSLRQRARVALDVQRVAMPMLQARGLYTRPTETRDRGYWDVISEAPMSTGHAIARFLVPRLCGYEGLALFADGDVLFRADVADVFALADPTKAIQVVQHRHDPQQAMKMEGHAQTTYTRKNWSSVILWNAGHPANRALTVELVNTVPGRDLHRFCWLPDDLIGALPSRWNVLIGEESDPATAIAHFTLGVPDMPGYEHQSYADEWYAAAKAAGYRMHRPPRPLEASV
jgi:hypothetical protein